MTSDVTGEERDGFDYEARMRALIAKRGFCVQFVFGEDVPPFAYTVGNHARGRPEFIVSGFGAETSEVVLGALVAETGRGWVPVPGRRAGIFPFDVEIVECLDWAKRERSLTAGRFAGDGHYSLVQAILPDPDMRFPDEEGCDPAYAAQERYDRPDRPPN